jgi:hypothetical protein
MSVFPKLGIYPIIIPVKVFSSKYGIAKNYVEMNPSIFINNEDVTILVRCVNYTKYPNNNFTLFENESNSLYYKLSGTIKDNFSLDFFKTEQLSHIYNIPTYWSYWKGLEDIRFLNNSEILVTVPECNTSGNPCIFRASLNDRTITNFKLCNPNTIEKNWMPYNYENSYKVIYNLSPFQVKSVERDDIEEITVSDEVKSKLKGYHGSSNGIDFLDEKLFLIHKNQERVVHRWLLFNPETRSVKISEPFVFFNHSYIEFTCSLAKHNGIIYVSLGVNDDKAFILEISQLEIAKWLY